MAKLNNTMIQRAAESQNTQFADTRCVATVKEVLDAVMQIDCDQEAEDYLTDFAVHKGYDLDIISTVDIYLYGYSDTRVGITMGYMGECVQAQYTISEDYDRMLMVIAAAMYFQLKWMAGKDIVRRFTVNSKTGEVTDDLYRFELECMTDRQHTLCTSHDGLLDMVQLIHYSYSSLISRLHTVNDNLNHLGVHHWIKR